MARDCVVAEERIVGADAAEGRAPSLAVRGEPKQPEPCSGEPNIRQLEPHWRMAQTA